MHVGVTVRSAMFRPLAASVTRLVIRFGIWACWAGVLFGASMATRAPSRVALMTVIRE